MKITIDPTKDGYIGDEKYFDIPEEMKPYTKEWATQQGEMGISPLRRKLKMSNILTSGQAKILKKHIDDLKSKMKMGIAIPKGHHWEEKVYEFIDEETIEKVKEKLIELQETKDFKGVDLEKYLYDFALLATYAKLFLPNGIFYEYLAQRQKVAKARKGYDSEYAIDQFFIQLREKGKLIIKEVKFIGVTGEDNLSITHGEYIYMLLHSFAEEYFRRVKGCKDEHWAEEYIAGGIPLLREKRTRAGGLKAEYFKKLISIYWGAVSQCGGLKELTKDRKLLLLGYIVLTVCDPKVIWPTRRCTTLEDYDRAKIISNLNSYYRKIMND